MSDQDSPRYPFHKQHSLTYLEQSLKMVSSPQQAPITIYPGPNPKNANLSKADLEIAERLEKLRRSEHDLIPTEEEMASRLAQLKGLPTDHYARPCRIQHDNRSDAQKVDDLVKQAMEEALLDSKLVKPEEEIEARLARLKGADNQSSNTLFPTALPNFCNTVGVAEGSSDMDEAKQLLQEAEQEASDSYSAALLSLHSDPDVGRLMAEAMGRHGNIETPAGDLIVNSTSDSEKFSPEDSSDEANKGRKQQKKKTKKPQKEKTEKLSRCEAEEVERIVQMYSREAEEEKKKKKQNHRSRQMASSSSSLSSDSELPSSEGEKLSNSSN